MPPVAASLYSCNSSYKHTRLPSPFKAVGKQVKKTIRNLDNRETKARHKLEQRWVEYREILQNFSTKIQILI